MTGTDVVDNDQYPRQIGEAGSQPDYSQPDHLTDKELLVIDAALYDEKFTETINALWDAKEDNDTTPVSLLDWANAWTPPDDPDGYNAHSTEEDWERLIAIIKANPRICDNGQGFSDTFHILDGHIIDTAPHDESKALMITRKVTTCVK